jgi:hypothetical protein
VGAKASSGADCRSATLNRLDSRGKTLADWLEKSGDPYLLERHDTVWVVRHWAAFVQRVPDLPLTALRNLLRTKGEYADWRAFYQAITPEQARWLREWREAIPQRSRA